MLKFHFFLLLITLSFSACNSNKPATEKPVENNSAFHLLDSIQAAKTIIIDEKDHFFRSITPIDMAIQMHRPLRPSDSQKNLIPDYKSYLQSDVGSFTEKEKQQISKVMIKALNLCNSMSANLVPQPIKLIKTKGNHYGNGAFYTREKCIIIPENDLKNFNEEAFLKVMLHEISHIITRYNPELRNKLYSLIGFEKIISPDHQLVLREPLKSKILNNPDGLSTDHAIQLVNPAGKRVWAIPLITSNYDNYNQDIPFFFGYLKFELFELEKNDSGHYEILTQRDGSSTLNLQQLPDFFEKIGDNTDYIIHPDEIIADNFYLMLLATNKIDGHHMDKFSKKGKQLILDIKSVIVSHN